MSEKESGVQPVSTRRFVSSSSCWLGNRTRSASSTAVPEEPKNGGRLDSLGDLPKTFAPNVAIERTKEAAESACAFISEDHGDGCGKPSLSSAVASLRSAAARSSQRRKMAVLNPPKRDDGRGSSVCPGGKYLTGRRGGRPPQSNKGNDKNDSGKTKSKNLMDLSWSDKGVLYTPTSLPFVVREIDDEGQLHQQRETEAGRIAATLKRPTVKHVDEANQHAADMFSNQATEDSFGKDLCGGSDFFLFQFPNKLPGIIKEEISKTETDASESTSVALPTKTASGTTEYTCSTFDQLPEGKLGTLQIFKSGNVKLLLGGQLFNVDKGSDCHFAQEVACCVGNSEMIFLGMGHKRAIVTPDICNAWERIEPTLAADDAVAVYETA